jgi:hypothetical protein
MSCTPTGIPPTLIIGAVTTGANSIEEGALNTKSPVGRGASGWPATSLDQTGAGPGQESVIAAIARAISFDHFVSEGEERGRHREAEHLCCLGVYDEFEGRWLFNGDVGRLGPLQYFIDLCRNAPK